MTGGEIASERKKLEKLFEKGFTIDREYCVAGMNQSWPRLNKDSLFVPGIAIFKRGGIGFGMTTLSHYLDQLLTYDEQISKMPPITHSIQSAPTASSSTTDREFSPIEEEDMSEEPGQMVSPQDMMKSWAAMGMKVNYVGPALLSTTKPLAPESDQVAALARFESGDICYEDSNGKMAIVRGSGSDKGKIIAIDSGMKRYPLFRGMPGYYDHGYLNGVPQMSDAPVESKDTITLNEKAIRQLATKLLAIPLEK